MYGPDLALIHDCGFAEVGVAAAGTVVGRLARAGIRGGTIVDIGCGAGNACVALAAAGFDTMGFDISPAMIERASARLPGGTFTCAGAHDIRLPRCVAVMAAGEVVSYTHDPGPPQPLRGLVQRAWVALDPGGVLVFDFVTRERVGTAGLHRVVSGDGPPKWLVAARTSRTRNGLVRVIDTFVERAGGWEHGREVHRQRFLEPDAVLRMVRGIGFRVRLSSRYGPLLLPTGTVVCVAQKAAPAD